MKKVMTLLILSTLSLNVAFGASLKCQTDRVEFKIGKTLNMRGEVISDTSHSNDVQMVGELPSIRRILEGHISVYMICEDNRVLQIKEITIPATAKLELKGVNLRGGSMGAYPYNSAFTIMNTRGKKLEDVLGNPFYGGKVAVTIGAGATLNPNLSVLRNNKGLIIMDAEKMLNVGPAWILGINLTTAKLQIFADFENIKEEDKNLLEIEL